MAAIDTSRLGSEALDLAQEQGLDFHKVDACGWALMVDAARTMASFPDPSPRGYPRASCMPEQIRSKAEIFGIERERISDGVRVDPHVRFIPSSRAIDRADEILRLVTPLRMAGCARRPDIAIRAVWLYAGGSAPARVKAILGVSKTQLHRYKERISLTLGRLVLPALEELAESA